MGFFFLSSFFLVENKCVKEVELGERFKTISLCSAFSCKLRTRRIMKCTIVIISKLLTHFTEHKLKITNSPPPEQLPASASVSSIT